MSVLRLLLFPFAVLYDAVTALRNALFDRGYKPATRFDIPVISVGNLAVGGTGKTPMVEYLIRLLTPEFNVAMLSRGYGRTTRGFKIADASDTAATIGDEPFQIYKKFGGNVSVVVGEDRAYAIPVLLQELESINAVIMDDAYQHRSVVPGLSILLTEYTNPFFNDYLLPAGRLREARTGAKRAEVIIVTKCPSRLSDDKLMEYENRIRRYSDKPVFFSTIRYGEPVGFGKPDARFSQKVILISAIANAHILETHVAHSYTMLKHFAFRDHYTITTNDLNEIESIISQNPEVSILTTEKDKVKLQRDELKVCISRLPIFYLPIETEFIRTGKDFDALMLSYMRSFKRD